MIQKATVPSQQATTGDDDAKSLDMVDSIAFLDDLRVISDGIGDVAAMLDCMEDDGLSIDLDTGIDLDAGIDLSAPVIKRPLATVPAVPTGKTPLLSLRIPPAVVEAYKAEAKRQGLRYQSLMIRALRAGSQDWAVVHRTGC